MRVALLILALVNLSLLGFLAVSQNRPAAGPALPEKDDRSAVILAKLALFAERDEKQAALLRDLQKELTGAHKELLELRTALTGLDEKAQKAGDEVRATAARLDRLSGSLQQVEKKLDQPHTEGKQVTELAGELKKLNEQFKRVIDFASGRSGL